jgi:hypothetical protein
VTPDDLARFYLDALERADLTAVLSLFADGAAVNSPLYGQVPASDFYPALFADTAQSHLTLRGVTRGSIPGGAPLVTIWFHFDWQLPSGRHAPFDAVDVLELDPSGHITALHIVYDTAPIRPVFEQETGRTSWRQHP